MSLLDNTDYRIRNEDGDVTGYQCVYCPWIWQSMGAAADHWRDCHGQLPPPRGAYGPDSY